MSSPEVETVTLPVNYYVDVETTALPTPTRFGPVHSYEDAAQLLFVLSGRSDVKKASLIKEVPS